MIYFSGTCHILVKYQTTFDSAKEHCHRKFKEAGLVEINSWEENNAVARLAIRVDLWIGYYKYQPNLPGKEGWEWTQTRKGNKFTKEGGAWALGEPNANGGHRSCGDVRCALIWGERKYNKLFPPRRTNVHIPLFMEWDDRGCDCGKWFVCERGKCKRSLRDQPCIR